LPERRLGAHAAATTEEVAAVVRVARRYGLPVVPPTEERALRMLEGTTRAAAEEFVRGDPFVLNGVPEIGRLSRR